MRGDASFRLAAATAAGIMAWLTSCGFAQARVAEVSDQGAVLRYVAAVPGPPDKAWQVLIVPASWWDGAHSYSGSATNLTLDPRPGGCFCEALPGKGGVEHMRVIHSDRGRLLRMSGALGPLQAEAIQGSLTFSLEAEQGGTRIVAEYVLAGYMRGGAGGGLGRIAPAVDAVLESQVERLAARLGGRLVQDAN